MRPARHTRHARAGFTLVELLVVITIIAILIALTAAAVNLALASAHRTQLRNEISELNKAVIAVQTEYNVKYIPSRIRLREDMAYTGTDQLDKDSFAFIHAMWPRLTIGTTVDWNGDGVANGPWDLSGDQCLVFFTGGIPSAPNTTPGTLGFSTNPTNPAAGVTGGARKGPYFQFQSNRLIRNGNNFLSYGDPLTGTPYAYFCSFSYWTKCTSGFPVANRYTNTGALPTSSAGQSDCNALNVSPYADAAPTNASGGGIPHYLNNDTFQIISAGANGVFGRGSMLGDSWSPQTAGATNATTDAGGTNPKAGTDDMANFYPNLLGIAP